MLDRLPIRWRLAVTSASLTFVILSMFAVLIGQQTTSRIRSDFNNEQAAAVDELRDRLRLRFDDGDVAQVFPDLELFAASNNAVIRVLGADGSFVKGTRGAPNFGTLIGRTAEVGGFRVETRESVQRIGRFSFGVIVQYGRRQSDLDATVASVRTFIGLGVFGGTALALVAGLFIAGRAMRPVTGLTSAATEITRTRDPSRRIAVPPGRASRDEVGELAATLDEMLLALQGSREETEAALARQRKFVADASHELRTPLTSIMANLELLAEVLDGERGEAAHSALRSSHRMRRLVADLLLLARADRGREVQREPCDLREIVVDVAAELGPIAGDHDFAIEAEPAVVSGARDDLHRLALNLMENALKHTPPGTAVEVQVELDGHDVVLAVEDDGPGIPPELRADVFERFVRGEGDRAKSFGLGLSIVKAVAEAHGGTVSLADPLDGVGARFVVRIPAASVPSGSLTPA